MDVPVSIESTDNVNALDFSFQFKQTNLSFNTVVANNNSLQALSNYNGDDKTVRFTSSSLQNLDLTKTIVAVRFATTGAAITEADLNSLKGYLNGDAVNVEVIGSRTATSVSDVLVNVYPNPANDLLNILTTENATVELLSIDGKTVIAKTNILANQKQELNTHAIADGVYMLKVANDNFVTMKKVVIKK